MRRLGTTLALATVATAIAAAPASGAATRAEYAAQANAICAASLPLYEEAGRDLARHATKLSGKRALRRPKVMSRVMRKMVRVMRRVNEVGRNENLQLSALVAAPGDETLVAAWLAARDELAQLSDESVDQLRDLLRILTGKPKLKDILKLITLAGEGERTAKQLEAKAEEVSLYGGQLGATACTGTEIPFSFNPAALVTA